MALHVRQRSGKVHLDGIRKPIGQIVKMGGSWLASGESLRNTPIPKISWHQSRREALDWVLAEWQQAHPLAIVRDN
jgi:hypothetical protein